MKFQWSSSKNADNRRKHFLDFEDAFEIFKGPILTEVDDRVDYGEIRTKGIGFLREIVVVLIFTEREGDIIRIISLRKATKYEREKFYKFLQDRLGSIENNV
ncbi:MAG: BrnT family toxin [Acidobacteria bacterium]|nr:BrnT family toxin [Acidobacteriota bacterium]